MKKTLITFLLSLALLTSFGVMSVNAQGGGSSDDPDTPSSGNIRFENPLRTGDTLYQLMEKIVNDIILPVGGVLAVLSFIYSGFMYVMAQGNEAKLKSANKALVATAIGTVLLLGAWVFARVIENTVNQLIA